MSGLAIGAFSVGRVAELEFPAFPDTGTVVMPHHFATPSCGTIEKAGDGFRFAFIEGS